MARRKTTTLTEREAQIMGILWDLQEVTAETVRARLPDDPHDSTVRTLLRVLVSKGHVHADRSQRPTIYRPAMPEVAAQRLAATGLLKRFFGGSAEALVLRLLEDEELTPRQLDQLKKRYGRRKPRKKNDEP